MALSSGFAGHSGLRLIEAPADPIVRREGATIWMSRGDEVMSDEKGVTHVHLWLHGAQAGAHEFHSGVAGSFAVAEENIERARERGIAVMVSSLLTRSSARVLAELPAWLVARRVRSWRVVVPRMRGVVRRAAGGLQVAGVGPFDGVVPRLAAAVPLALQALAMAARAGLSAGIGGAPYCLLGPFVAVDVPEPARAYAGVCTDCPARARCPGVDEGYLRRFAGDELSPRGLRAGGGGGAPPTWMFPGPGTLEQVATDMPEETAQKIRLPVLQGGPGER